MYKRPFQSGCFSLTELSVSRVEKQETKEIRLEHPVRLISIERECCSFLSRRPQPGSSGRPGRERVWPTARPPPPSRSQRRC